MSAWCPGACFSEFGVDVVCVDKDAGKIDRAEARRDPDLRARARRAGRRQRQGGAADLHDRPEGRGRSGADAVFIAVGTPTPARRRPCRPDLCLRRGRGDRGGARTAIPWSSPSRPCRSAPAARSSGSSARRGPTPTFDVASNPEFLREGSAINDFMRPDRVVIGTETERAREVMRAALPAALPASRRRSSSPRWTTAELIKYAANTFLATKITFINEIADLCEKVGADVQDVAARHRPGRAHRPQVPACRARAMADRASPRTRWRWCAPRATQGAPLRIVETVVEVNDTRKKAMAERIVAACGGVGRRQDGRGAGPHLQAQHRRHARFAPSLDIVPALQAAGAQVRAFDPEGMARGAEAAAGRALVRGRLRRP